MTNKKLIDDRYKRKVDLLKKKHYDKFRIEREGWKFELSCACLGTHKELSAEEKQYISSLRSQLSGDMQKIYMRIF